MTEYEVKEIEVAIKHIESRNMSAKHLNMAIEALEKQIPKKPIYQGESDMCPNCGACYIFGNCCIECGQKIDWE